MGLGEWGMEITQIRRQKSDVRRQTSKSDRLTSDVVRLTSDFFNHHSPSPMPHSLRVRFVLEQRRK